MTTDAAKTPTPPDDLADRLSVTVDQDAASGDLLPVLARLLIDLATKRNGPPTGIGGPFHVFPTADSEGTDCDEFYRR